MEKAQPRLPAHEWAAVITFLTILAFIAVLNLWVNRRDSQLSLPNHTTNVVTITIEGAVLNPGTYKVQKGEKLSSIMEKAGLLHDADVSSLNLQSSLKSDEIVIIPQKKMLTVFLEGNVTPRGAFKLEANSTLHDLFKSLDKTPPQKDRKLQHEEVIKF